MKEYLITNQKQLKAMCNRFNNFWSDLRYSLTHHENNAHLTALNTLLHKYEHFHYLDQHCHFNRQELLYLNYPIAFKIHHPNLDYQKYYDYLTLKQAVRFHPLKLKKCESVEECISVWEQVMNNYFSTCTVLKTIVANHTLYVLNAQSEDGNYELFIINHPSLIPFTNLFITCLNSEQSCNNMIADYLQIINESKMLNYKEK